MHPNIAQLARMALDAQFAAVHRVVLLDFPNYDNIGDSLIWLGMLEYLNSKNIHICYASDVYRYRPQAIRSYVDRGATIVMQGGGNFGDIYALHQQFRLRVVEDFPKANIIVMPQTVFYTSRDRLSEDAQRLSRARHLHIFSRDEDSLCDLRSVGLRTTLCPDSAHFLELKQRGMSRRVVELIRNDVESAGSSPAGPIRDWPARPQFIMTMKKLTKLQTLRWHRALEPAMVKLYAYLARERLRCGQKLLGDARILVTDRLHGVILGLQGGRTVVATDNSYGKLGRYANAWLSREPNLHLTDNIEDARKIATELNSSFDSRE